MMGTVFEVCGVLAICAIGFSASKFQQQDESAQQNELPSYVIEFDWSKEFDASLETNPERKMLARQYAALEPVAKKMRALFVRDRIPALSVLKLEVKQLEIRWQLETDLKEKKNCLEYLVFRLKQIQESHLFLMEQPAPVKNAGSVQIGQDLASELIRSTLETVKWESKLEQVNGLLANENK